MSRFGCRKTALAAAAMLGAAAGGAALAQTAPPTSPPPTSPPPAAAEAPPAPPQGWGPPPWARSMQGRMMGGQDGAWRGGPRMGGPGGGWQAAARGGPMGPRGALAGLVMPRQDKAITAPEAVKIVEGFLLWMGERDWKVANAREQDGAIHFDLTTKEGSRIATFTMDRKTGRLQRVG